MYRVFFDSNAGNATVGFILWFDQSRRDIENIKLEDRDGANVILYMPDELEISAELRYDACLGFWRGFPTGDIPD
jgi:hypothetical protein